MGKRQWFRNGNLINLLVGTLSAALIAAYEYWVAEQLKTRIKKRRKRKKGGAATKRKKKVVVK